MLNINFPWNFDERGQTAVADNRAHVRQLLEMVLFTNPGERVNRPDFGCGLLQLVFEPNSEQLAAALQASVQASLHQWLGDVIAIESLEVAALDAILEIELNYIVTRTGEQRSERLQRSLA
jgi:uncharacterized protein